MRTLRICACLAWLTAPQLEADATGTANAGRVAWLVCAHIPEDLENPVRVLGGHDATEVTLSKRSAGEAIAIPDDGTLRLARAVAEPAAGETTSQTLAIIKIPEQINQALVFLLPASPNSEGLVFHTKVRDLADFKGGDWLYLNLTPLDLRIEIGGSQMVVKPREEKIHHIPNAGEAVNLPVSYSRYDPGTQEWQLFSASTIMHSSTRREICIFNLDARTKRINFHGITLPCD